MSNINEASTQLFPGEDIRLIDTAESFNTSLTDEQINEKYLKGEVRIVTEQARYPLTAIKGMLESGDYLINPEFQRRHRWPAQKKAKLIESLLMNVPIPPIFLYEDRFSHFEVMDGLQRLSAISDFYSDKFALEGLTEWPEINGRKYSELPSQIQKGIDRRYLSSIILLKETAKDPQEAQFLKQLVFERINSGGVQLEPQESRNAIYPGPLNALCIRLSRHPSLCKTFDIPEPDEAELTQNIPSSSLIENDLYRKMEDVELVLRFFAYRQRLSNQKGSLKTYFDKYLQMGNAFPVDLLKSLENLFNSTINLAYEIFGEQAFWLYRRRNGRFSWYQRPTTVIYDPLMYTLSHRLDQKEQLIQASEKLRSGLPEYYIENYNLLEGRYTNLSNISERINLFSTYIDRNI